MEDQLKSLPNAPQWSLIVGKIGSGAVQAGIVLFVLSLLLCFWPKDRFGKFATAGFVLGSVCLFTAIATLGLLFANQQFHFEYIFSHSDPTMVMKYRIAAIWSAQQGSFLLWGVCSAIFGLLALRGTGPYRRVYVGTFCGFLATICAILNYETPFKILPGIVVDGVVKMPEIGNGMTPSLQNYWVVVHPPTIFLGFGSLAVMFAYGLSAMLTGDIKDYVSRVRPWTLVSLAVLGLGISMGGLWAYETQGWGGFWAWDPVENVSFVPWLFVATLTHGLIVQATKQKWHWSNLLMSGLPFLTFVYGTFLTRSGLLDKTSVHSFASMDKSAAKILVWLLAALVVGYAVALGTKGRMLAKAEATPMTEEESGLNRESSYRFGILLLSMFAVVIAAGMSWPVITDLISSRAQKVEEPLYHKVVVWFYVPILLMMAVAPFVTWKNISTKAVWGRVMNAFSITIGLMGFSLIAIKHENFGVGADPTIRIPMPFNLSVPLVPWMFFLLFICTFTAVANIWRIGEMFKRSKMGIGGFVAHAGFAILLGGLILSRGYERKEQIMVQEGRPKQALGYTVAFKTFQGKSPQDRDGKALFDVTDPTGKKSTIEPGLYYYTEGAEDKAMTWPHIERQLSHDMYYALHTPVTEAWNKPRMFAPGQTQVINDFEIPYTVTYKGLKTEGELGTPSAKFIAEATIDIRYKLADGTEKVEKYDVAPSLQMGSNGDLVPATSPMGNDLRVAMLKLDAATKSAELQVYFSKPIFPMEVFYKPMTGFVWLGTGILTLGGLIAAVSRRRRKVVAVLEEEVIEPTPQRTENATIPAPQS